MTTTQLNIRGITDLLNNAAWDYVYNMQRVDEDTMRSLIGQIESTTITSEQVQKAYESMLLNGDVFESNEQVANHIADSTLFNHFFFLLKTTTT